MASRGSQFAEQWERQREKENPVPRAASSGLSDWIEMAGARKSGEIGRGRGPSMDPENPIPFPVAIHDVIRVA